MIYYKIRKKGTDLFLKGTPTYHSYTKEGRVFQKIGGLRTFLSNILSNDYRSRDIGDWEIVEYELTESAVKGVHEVIKPEKLIQLLKR